MTDISFSSVDYSILEANGLEGLWIYDPWPALVDNTSLDAQGFAPFAEVVEGMSVADALYGGYGEGRPQGAGPSQGRIAAEGNAYLESEFPRLDFIRTARVVN